LKKKTTTAELVVCLDKIPKLKTHSFSAKKLTLGPMVTVAEVAESPAIKDSFPVLSTAAGKLGSQQVRNRATIGGNICTASPAGDTIGPLIAYDATVRVTGAKGVREVTLQSVFLGPGKTTIGRDEILTAILLKTPARNTGGSYAKYGTRNAMEIAIVSVTCLVTLQSGVCRSARIVLGAVAPTFIRCPEAEEFLTGKEITEDVARQAARLAAAASRPSTRVRARAGADYRRELVNVLVRRGLLDAAGNAAN
jgi:CO/xanthine dehydrogenase FAD-binding subunit